MEHNNDASWGLSRRSALLGGLCLAVASAVAALFVCSARVDMKRQVVLNDYSSSVNAWLEGTASAVGLWEGEMKEMRLRISDSETYRLFADDLHGLDRATVSRIQKSGEVGEGQLSGTAAVLSEEVPVIRRLLKEFMDFSGLNDARIVSEHGVTLLSAQSKPAALSSLQQEAARRAVTSGKTVFLPVRADSSGLLLDVFEPMRSLENSNSVVAAFMATRPVLADITQFAARPKPEELAEAVFLQRNTVTAGKSASAQWETVASPRPKAVSADISAQLDAGKGTLALGMRESLGTLGTVYSAAYPVAGTDWAVVLETPAQVLEQRMFHASLPIYVASALGWAAFMLFCLLVWWMGVGRQQKAVAAELRGLHQLVSRQKELLDSVNISLDMALFMADVKGQIHVCNRAFVRLVGAESEEALKDQMLFHCLPLEAAGELVDRIRQVAIHGREDGCELWLDSPLGQTDGVDAADRKRLFRVSLFPFLDSSESNVRESLRGAVVTMKDITEFRRRSERARQQQRRLIEAFTSVEASADPYLYGHSLRMADLGEKVSRVLELDDDSRNTVVMGAQLSQLGKLFIPRDLLSKSGRLTPEELAEVQRAPEHAARVLGSVDFDLPIARALHEMYENMDGSGYPRGLRGDDILPEARLLGVLNAYCAMVSDRAYRQGMSHDEAMSQLRDPAKFDQQMVDALEKALR